MSNQFLHGVEVLEVDDGIRPIRAINNSIIGIIGTAPNADGAKYPINTPILIDGPRKAATLGAGGTLKDAYDAIYTQGASVAVIIRVDVGASSGATQSNVIGSASNATGVFAFEAAASKLDLTPRILIAPGFTTNTAADKTTVNPVTSNLMTVAEKLRAIVIADGPNTNEADAKTDRKNFGSDRLFMVDPSVSVFDTKTKAYMTRPASAYVAGLIAKRDVERGFWWSPSNQIINGISATARPISFNLSSRANEDNRLNEAEVATIIRQNGFRLWGNRTTASDPLWAFLSVRRTADVVNASIERAHLWAMDRPMSAQLFKDIRDSVQFFGQGLVNQGALLGFECWMDKELNTKDTLKAGKLYLDYKLEPPAPLEHLIFRARREGDYYNDLIEQVGANSN